MGLYDKAEIIFRDLVDLIDKEPSLKKNDDLQYLYNKHHATLKRRIGCPKCDILNLLDEAKRHRETYHIFLVKDLFILFTMSLVMLLMNLICA